MRRHAVFVRSVHPHVRIVAIDVARTIPGVLAVLTGTEASADRLGGIPWEVRPPVAKGTDEKTLPPMGSSEVAMPQPMITRDVVRYVGEIVAMVVAETKDYARGAAERVEIDYAHLPVVIATADSPQPGTPLVWPQIADNVCFSFQKGGRAALEAAFAKAHHVTRLELVNIRLVASPIETRGYVGAYDNETGLCVSRQAQSYQRDARP
jgi:aerobic carbon-monoxide dehydrogenase large subunit